MSNAYQAAVNEEFQRACARAGIPPTRRQYSKWANKKGLAYDVQHGKKPVPENSTLDNGATNNIAVKT